MTAPLRGWLLLGVAGVALALAGCYRPELARCAVSCADGASCPAGLSCADDGYCHAVDDDRSCPDVAVPDAAVDDGAVVPDGDGPPDGGPPTFDYTGVFAGARHACAIHAGGLLRCWGQNTSLQLALPAVTRRTGDPTDLPGAGWTAIDGSHHTCGIRAGTMYCWGANNAGEAGQPASVSVPTISQVGADDDWVDVCTGDQHTCGIRDDGSGRRVYCWGSDVDRQLGDGADDSGDEVPREIAPTTGVFADWADVSCGLVHTCARRDGGETYCWGEGGHGELGTDDMGDYPVPTAVVAATGFTQVAAGFLFSCGIGTDSNLYCWGDNGSGQLGRSAGGSSAAPTRVGSDSGWTAVTAGFYGACGLRAGQVYCWGGGGYGEIGDGGWTSRYAPTLVDLAGVVEISSGDFFNCARTDAGEIWCWGRNGDGQLGNGQVATKYVPTRIGEHSDWQAVAAGLDHTCAVRDADPTGGVPSGELYCWGWNGDGAVGVASPDEIPSPVQVMPTGGETGWLEVGVGSDHGCAIRDGDAGRELWCWGASGSYQVGNEAQGSGHPPQRVAASTVGFDNLSAAPYANCALIAGARWCWGEGASGQLGTTATSNLVRPTQVSTDSLVWSSISLGALYGCGTAAGGLYCWGTDSAGQQGQGAGDQSTLAPTAVVSAGTWTEVAASFRGTHVCGIVDQTLRCWGGNGSGQLGLDHLTSQQAPTTVGSLVGWSAISLGSLHTCGIVDGDLYCWGSNDEAQLGNEQLVPYADTPRKIDDARTWSRLSAGQNHTCAITDAGELWCWGANVRGAIGDGTQSRNTPVRTIR